MNRISQNIPNTITVAMTGASGAAYGLRLVDALLRAQKKVYFLASNPALMVMAQELDLKLSAKPREMARQICEYLGHPEDHFTAFGRDQWTAPIASGSRPSDAMVVIPCTSGTLSSIATGASNNLLERAADVIIKERLPLILVHRETPLSAIHLENMLTLTRNGVTILPANPGFYHRPQSLDDIVDFIVARVLDHLGIDNQLSPRWG